jgi:type I restriction enzyme S subunit
MKKEWRIVPMSNLCSISSGESDTQDAVPDGAYAFFDRSKTIKRSSRFLYDCEALIIPGEGKEFLPKHFQGKFDLHQRAYALFDFVPALDVRFLYHFLHHRSDYFPSVAVGATVKSLRRRHFENLPVPLPPLPEQKRIVGILDEASDGIATAKANAEKNLQNARTLFESYLQAIFAKGGEGWVPRCLGDIFDIGSSKRILETEWTSAGVPFYGGKEIVKLAKCGTVVSNAYISEEKYQDYASKYDMPRQGDILITARGTIGVGYVVKDGDKFYYKDGNIISMRAKTPTNPHFLLYAFRSNAMADQLGDLTGTTVRHLPIEKAKRLVLRMPGFAAQNAVVAQIRRIEDETLRLGSLYERKLVLLESLKRSLLNRAFSGEL